MSYIELINHYNGIIMAVSSIILTVITYFYLVETIKMRAIYDKLINHDNSLLIIEISPINHDNKTNLIWFELKMRNIGSKPLRNSSFKLLTKRSPRECISHNVYLCDRETYLRNLKINYIASNDYEGLMPGETITYYINIQLSFLDIDKSFYVWIKYIDFYKNIDDEVRLISIADEKSQQVLNINVLRKYDKNSKYQYHITKLLYYSKRRLICI